MTPVEEKMKKRRAVFNPSNNVYRNYQSLQWLLGDTHIQRDWTEGHLQQYAQLDAFPLPEFCGIQQPKNLSCQSLLYQFK